MLIIGQPEGKSEGRLGQLEQIKRKGFQGFGTGLFRDKRHACGVAVQSLRIAQDNMMTQTENAIHRFAGLAAKELRELRQRQGIEADG